MKNQAWSQILALVLAVVISLYFWLGTIVVVIVGLIALMALLLHLWRHRKTPKSEDSPQRTQRGERSAFAEHSEKIIERRRAQGRRLVEIAEQIESIKPEYKRLLERLLDWYFDYLKSNTIYHQDLYDYLLQVIKERNATAKAQYLKRELQHSKAIVRCLIRGFDAQRIVEQLDADDDDNSQE